jgi:PAS domain S-box-containing protein
MADLNLRYQAMLAAVPDIIVEVDAQKRIRWMNDAGFEFFGNAVGREAADFFEGEQDTYDMVAPLFAGDETVIYVESWQRRRDGEPRLLAWWCRVLKAASGEVIGALSTARDITDRSRMEARLEQSEKHLRLIFDNAPIAIAVYDLEGRFVRVNRACVSLWGYSESELLEKTFRAMTHPDDVPKSLACFERLASGAATTQIIEKRFLRSDGQVFHGLLHASAIPGADGRPRGIVAQILDLTEQIKAEEEARRHRERLAHVARVNTMGEMAAAIAHEINQPLSAITTYAEACQGLIADGRAESAEVSQALQEITTQALRAGEVLRRVRRFVGKHDLERTPVDLNGVVREAAQLADLEDRRDRFRNRFDLIEPLPAVLADAVQVQQVLLNLIRNGREAAANHEDASPEITVRTRMYGDTQIEVTVEDRGGGLPPDIEREIFNPFFTTKPSGMGMGLSMSRSIVESHGGRLWFTRNDAGGTSFHFTLPITNEGHDG